MSISDPGRSSRRYNAERDHARAVRAILASLPEDERYDALQAFLVDIGGLIWDTAAEMFAKGDSP